MIVGLWTLLLALVGVAPDAPSVTIIANARSIQPGELVVLTITTSESVNDVRGHAFDRALAPYKVSDTTWRALVGIDLDVKPGTYVVTLETGSAAAPIRATHRLVVRAKQFPTRRLTVDPAFVNPPPTVLARIDDDARRLAEIWAAVTPTSLWRGAFVAPVPEHANSAFGTRSVFNGEARSPHGGADFPSPAGTPIHAPNAGRVVLARDLYYTGQTVAIDHGLGLVSLFAHLSVIGAKEGDRVNVNQVIGQVGSTGRVTGPHLHWTVRANGARVDPMSLLAVLGASAPVTR